MKSMIIRDVFHSIKNGANIKQDKSSGGIPITRIETIVDNKFDFDKLGYSGINDETFSNYYLEEGDILMSHINSVSHLGKVAIFENKKEKIIHGMNLLCLKANTNIVLPQYAYYFFRSPVFISSLIKITKKSVNQASFNITNLEKIKIIIPEKLSDQMRIATVLNKAETLIQQRKASITLVDELLKSTFSQMFIPYFDKKFSEKLTSLCLKITDGTHDTPERLKEGIKFITGKHIRPFVIDFENSDYVTTDVHNEIYKRCNPVYGDILYTNIGVNLGTAAMNNVDFEFSMKNVALLKPNTTQLSSRYLEHLLNFENKRNRILTLNSSGGAQQFLSLGQIKNIDIPLPPIELQNEFASIVEKAEVLKAQFKKSLIELENLFGSLSQRSFKGELDLSTLRVLVEEEEYQNYANDRTEPDHFPDPKIIVEFPEKSIQSAITSEMQEFIKSTDALSKMLTNTSSTIKLSAIYEKLWPQIEQVNKMMSPFEKLTKLPESVSHAMKTFESIKSISSTLQENKKIESARITWEEVNFQQVSNWIKNKYDGFHFNSEMLIRFLTEEHVTFPNYYSSEELKTNPKLSEADDIKSFIFSALNNENPFIKLEQVFFDATKENIELDLHDEDYELIKDKGKSERSGIYFKVVE